MLGRTGNTFKGYVSAELKAEVESRMQTALSAATAVYGDPEASQRLVSR